MKQGIDFQVNDRELVARRAFDAPAQVVFDALTQPRYVQQWWSPKSLGFTWADCTVDLQPDGRWRYALHMPDGRPFGFSGQYREIIPPRRLVLTEQFDDMPGHGYVLTLQLDETAGRTTLTATLAYQSNADRDAHYSAGMAAGMRESWDQLADLVAALAAG